MKTETLILASAILFTGLMAGIFFTWSNAVKPGIGKLSDLEYLRSLQSMNRVILNNTFKVLFMGAILSVALVPIFYFSLYPSNIFWVFVGAFVIYWVGAFGVTVAGNIPLNEILDKTHLESISSGRNESTKRSHRNQVEWLELGSHDCFYNKFCIADCVISISREINPLGLLHTHRIKQADDSDVALFKNSD
jgi:uncharacterized membrane protein